MKKVFPVLFLILVFQSSFAQISGIINIYTKVIAIDLACNKITVSSSSGFAVGDTILIIQMQGATIDETSTTTNPTFGNITNVNSAGNYEFATIAAIQGNDLFLKHTLLKSYDVTGSVQIISVPQFTNVTITGLLTAKTWDGNTGGVLVFEASGTVTFGADIDVSAVGFRGGNINSGTSTACGTTSVYSTAASSTTAFKGEGIAKFILNKETGRGKQANGGGGGNSNNTGGGGGSNYGKGGDGGFQSNGCFLSAPGSPGIGGLALTYSNALGKIFMGGGGGGGHQNNWTSPGPPTWIGGTPGGNGGGIVLINANAIAGNGNSILAKGGLSPLSRAWGDGGGGGGGGGTVLISALSYSSALNVNVTGGKGDDVYDETSRDLGPGGGGGGGILWVNNAAVNPNITLVTTGGASGLMVGVTTSQTAHGAQAGNTGGFLTNLALPRSATIFNQSCISLPVELIRFTGRLLNGQVKLEWSTSSERDNDFFTIERSTDLSLFTKVGSVKGSGTSTSLASYFLYDNEPADGVAYYRLSQTDYNGIRKVVGLITVQNILSEKILLNIYPIPFHDLLTLEINARLISSDTISVTLFNNLGALVYSSELDTQEKIELPLYDLAAGMYTLLLQTSERVEAVKVIKE